MIQNDLASARSTVVAAVERARALAPITTFPTVDELIAGLDEVAAAHPAQVTRTELGTSRLGERLPCYSVGSGDHHLVITGGVHPNEPIGFRTIEHLVRLLTADDRLTDGLNATWHLVANIDPDGTRLNEPWFSAPTDRIGYSRDFYRPAPDEQVEWSFPFSYKQAAFDRPMPETKALMGLFDRVEPALFVGLHNAEVGGVYYYINQRLDRLVDDLVELPGRFDLPLDIGEPEIDGLEQFGTAVFGAPLTRERYDYVEALGLNPVEHVAGGGSADYLEQYDTLTMVAELPYWSHPDAADATPTEHSYVEVIRKKARALDDLGQILTATLDRVEPHLTLNTPWRRAAWAFAPMMPSIAESEFARITNESDRPATRAEVFSNADLVRCFRLRFGSITLRALDAECHAGTAPPEVRRERDHLRSIIEDWYVEAEAAVDLQPLPIEQLVGVQTSAVLYAALAAVERREGGA